MDGVTLSQVECECILGTFPEERTAPQVVRWDLELSVDTKRAAVTGQLARTTDYVRVTSDVTRLLQFRQYQLIETAAEEIAGMLLSCYPQVEQLRLELRKPAALPQRSNGAAVRVTRTRVDYPTARFAENGVVRTDVLTTFEATLSVLALDPGARISTAASPSLSWIISAEQLAIAGGKSEAGVVGGSGVVGEAAIVHNSTQSPLILFQCAIRKP